MIANIILISIIIIIIIVIAILENKQSCIIDDSLYPELHIFKPNDDLMYTDLKQALFTSSWTDISNITQDKLKKMQDYMEPADTRVNTVKYFIFISNDIAVNNNIQTCPNIITLINAVPNVTFAAIMCMKTSVVSNNIAFLPDMYICFIPISQANDEFGLIVNNYVYKYSDLLKNVQFLITDSNCNVQVYNKSEYDKYAIILYLRHA